MLKFKKVFSSKILIYGIIVVFYLSSTPPIYPYSNSKDTLRTPVGAKETLERMRQLENSLRAASNTAIHAGLNEAEKLISRLKFVEAMQILKKLIGDLKRIKTADDLPALMRKWEKLYPQEHPVSLEFSDIPDTIKHARALLEKATRGLETISNLNGKIKEKRRGDKFNRERAEKMSNILDMINLENAETRTKGARLLLEAANAGFMLNIQPYSPYLPQLLVYLLKDEDKEVRGLVASALRKMMYDASGEVAKALIPFQEELISILEELNIAVESRTYDVLRGSAYPIAFVCARMLQFGLEGLQPEVRKRLAKELMRHNSFTGIYSNNDIAKEIGYALDDYNKRFAEELRGIVIEFAQSFIEYAKSEKEEDVAKANRLAWILKDWAGYADELMKIEGMVTALIDASKNPELETSSLGALERIFQRASWRLIDEDSLGKIIDGLINALKEAVLYESAIPSERFPPHPRSGTLLRLFIGLVKDINIKERIILYLDRILPALHSVEININRSIDNVLLSLAMGLRNAVSVSGRENIAGLDPRSVIRNVNILIDRLINTFYSGTEENCQDALLVLRFLFETQTLVVLKREDDIKQALNTWQARPSYSQGGAPFDFRQPALKTGTMPERTAL